MGRPRARVIGIVALLAACGSPLPNEPQVLGGVEISHAVLESGRRVYARNCAPCHGTEGDGRGPSGRASWPPPRDFTTAKFKFAGIADRGLPDDGELARIIGHGLAGATMPAFDLPESELRDVIDYIKTFSPPGKGFRDETLAVSKPNVGRSPNATASQVKAAIARGEVLYHEVFECAKCHPSQRTGSGPVAKWSDNYRSILLPTAFGRHPMRAVRVTQRGHDLGDIYRAVAYGLQGPMPGTLHLGEANVWDVAHYVKSLADESAAARPISGSGPPR